jgi:hypothetical protein
VGVIAILLFNKRFFPNRKKEVSRTVETESIVNDEMQVL